MRSIPFSGFFAWVIERFATSARGFSKRSRSICKEDIGGGEEMVSGHKLCHLEDVG